MSEKRVLVGQIGAAHGIRGAVRLKSFTVPPEAIADYGPLATEDGARQFTIVRQRPADSMLIVEFREVPDRNVAETLTNLRLFVDRSTLPAAEDEETFYHADLIGLRAEGSDGTVYGEVIAVPDFGAGDLLEIRPDEGSSVYLPFTRAFVPVVDPAGGRVVIDPPEGLFGGEEEEAPPAPKPPFRRKAGPKKGRPTGEAGGGAGETGA